MEPQSPSQVPIPFTQASASQGVTIVAHDRELHMYRLTSDEIDTICEAGNYKTLDLALFSVCFGVLATLGVTLLTVDTLTPSVQRSFVNITYISALGSVFFGVRAKIAWGKTRRTLKRLKGEQ